MSSLAFWRGTGLISEVEESDDEENGIKTKAEIEINILSDANELFISPKSSSMETLKNEDTRDNKVEHTEAR